MRLLRAGFDFRVIRTPVRIEWSFLAVIAAVGWYYGQDAWTALTWVAVVVVGVLVHEGGHVWALSTFGRRSRVRLAWFSGLTIAEDDGPLDRGPSILVSLAGPAAALANGLMTEGLLAAHDDGLLGAIRRQSLLVNLLWSAFNLLPVMPLDGGHVMRELFDWCGQRRWTTIAACGAVTANLVAGVIAITADTPYAWWILAGAVLIATNVVFLPLTPTRRQRQDVERLHRRMLDGELAAAVAPMQAHLIGPRSHLVGPEERTTLAWSLLLAGRFDELARVDLTRVVPAHHPYLAGAVAWYRGDLATATHLVNTALAEGALKPPPAYFDLVFGRIGERQRLMTPATGT